LKNTHTDWLAIDAHGEARRIAERLKAVLSRDLQRQGLVLGLSGGIDSSVTAALAVKALGAARVFGVLMPERHSEPETRRLSTMLADSLGIDRVEEDITGTLESVGCYRRYDAAVSEVVPGFGPGWKSKIAIQPGGQAGAFSFFVVIAQSPDGQVVKRRLTHKAYLEVVAATNFKQRTRKMLEYFHADRLNFAVAGTPNRLEYDQGFFVKGGDGLADVKPIAHLYKSQVYQLAAALGVPDEIRRRPPTTDTYSLAQGQEEFYFGVPYQQMDVCLYGKNHAMPLETVAAASALTPEQVTRVWADIDRKRRATRYLHLPAQLVGDANPIVSANT
jgi:NAD+ synthase